MPGITPSNPHTALLDLDLAAVALCAEGANSRADIILTKSRKETNSMPDTFEDLMKALEPKQAELVNTHIAGITKAHDTVVKDLEGKVADLTAKNETLEKSKPTPSAEDILKNASPEIQLLIKTQQEQLNKMLERDAQNLAAVRFEKCKAIPADEATLKDVLKTASPAVVEILEKAAAAIVTNTETAKGSNKPGEFQKHTVDADYDNLAKAAKTLQTSDSTMTFETAFTKACEQNPELYAKYREGME